MTDDRRKRVEELFDAALEVPDNQREAFLDEQCGDDHEFRASVKKLLDAHERSSGFLDPPVPAAAMNLLSEYTDEGMIGRDVGPYHLTEVIGTGGMGTVFQAVRRDDTSAAPVAVKLIRPGMDSQDVLRRFAHERETLAKLTHPGIARMLDGGMTNDGRPYLVMEYVEGVPITQYCDQERLTLSERLQLIKTVCEAVGYAHRNLVIHRDIKPSNVLVTPEGVPKLLDFGIAKLVAPSGSDALTKTVTALRFATPQYASPEVIRGQPASTSMDVYSLGLVLYELLTGHHAYELDRKSPGERERTICEEEPTLPSTAVTTASEVIEPSGTTRTIDVKTISALRGCTPQELHHTLRGDLDNVVFAAIHKDPTRRYASIDQLFEDIERYLGGFPVRARKDSFGYRAQKFLQRHRVGVVVAAVLLLGFTIGVAGVTYGFVRAKREAARARLEAEKARRTSGVLQDMFASASPEEGYRDTKVRDVLGAAVRTVEVNLADQPQVLASIQTTIGESYLALGLHNEAAPSLRSALEIRKRLYGERHEAVADSLLALGRTMTFAGEYDEAEALLNSALATNRDLLGNQSPPVARTLAAWGMLEYKRGDTSAAKARFQRAVQIAREALGGDHPDLSFSLEKLGLMHALLGEFADAERFCREALEMNKRIYGEKHPRIARGTRALAIVFHLKRDFEEAEPLYRAALKLDRELLGNEHPTVARTLHNFGTLLQAAGREAEAIPLLEESLAIRRAAFGDEHRTVAVTLNNLSTAVGLQQAEPYLRQSLEIARKIFGNDHPHVADTLQNLAAMYRARGDYAKAEPLYREAMLIFDKQLGQDHVKVSYPLRGLGECLLRRGDAEAAEPLLRRAYDIRERSPSKDDELWATAQITLGACLTKLGRKEEAERLLLEGHQFLIQEDDQSEYALLATKWLTSLYESWGKPLAAAKYRAMLETVEPPLPDEVP
ncbi:MAG: serine/threonine-protein kinase [Phycisphaerae bacterium]|jgi:serine/threonine-protein kinase